MICSASTLRIARRLRAGAKATVFWVALSVIASCAPDAPSASARLQQQVTIAATSVASPRQPPVAAQSTRGFRSRRLLDEHFTKHGAEFGRVSRSEYLGLAQQLRDHAVGGDVLEIVRADGVASRFDRASGAFLAFDRDGTIRTFFKPNDGERYFRRQAQRSH